MQTFTTTYFSRFFLLQPMVQYLKKWTVRSLSVAQQVQIHSRLKQRNGGRKSDTPNNPTNWVAKHSAGEVGRNVGELWVAHARPHLAIYLRAAHSHANSFVPLRCVKARKSVRARQSAWERNKGGNALLWRRFRLIYGHTFAGWHRLCWSLGHMLCFF